MHEHVGRPHRASLIDRAGAIWLAWAVRCEVCGREFVSGPYGPPIPRSGSADPQPEWSRAPGRRGIVRFQAA